MQDSTECIFHISHFSLFIPIFQALQCLFLFCMFFRFSRHISCPNMCVSHFPHLSVFSPYSRSYNVYVSFSTFFRFLAIFQVLACEFLIFLFGHFSRHFELLRCFSHFSTFFSVSRHIPGPIVCVSNFYRFPVLSPSSRS